MTFDPGMLKRSGIRLTEPRRAVAEFLFSTRSHFTADEIWRAVRKRMPAIARATVYNTLDLLVRQGMMRRQVLKPGTIVYDPMMTPHHHFIDEETGEIHDIPWDDIEVRPSRRLKGVEWKEYTVVVRGRRRRPR